MAPVSGLQKISTPDGSLAAIQAGSGPGVLIVHSLLTDWTAFAPVLPWLAGRFRVTLVNLPGFHGSAPVEAGIENYGERLAAAFDGFGLGARTPHTPHRFCGSGG